MREHSLYAQTRQDGGSRQRAGSLCLLLALLPLLLTACASNTGLLGGGSWQTSGLQNQHIQVLAVDPNHLQRMYAGDAQAGVFASSDAGVTWRASSVGLPMPLSVNALSFDTPAKTLYAATSAGLFLSRDSAASWSRAASTPVDSYSALAFDVNTPQVVYAATGHSGVLVSRDGGFHWTAFQHGLPTEALTSVLYDPNRKQLWAASADALYRSDDNGANWRAMSAGLPAQVGINALALGVVLSGTSDVVFVGTDHGFFLSSDGGQHWAQSQFSLEKLKVSAVLLDANQSDVVYASTNIGVLRSNDSGQNWIEVGDGLPGKLAFAGIAQGDLNYSQLFVATGGVYRYPGSGGSFSPSRLLPVILVGIFFVLLYYFFISRRRRRLLASPGVDGSARGGQSVGNKQNGRYPSSGRASADEKPES